MLFVALESLRFDHVASVKRRPSLCLPLFLCCLFGIFPPPESREGKDTALLFHTSSVSNFWSIFNSDPLHYSLSQSHIRTHMYS
ncbi:hypothetical protein CCUS01_01927 [Colletotrichum cuscutae]|uniref:Uncharacterized protein n=1 Tax=Colletotrichum cuscutae TaxID=1209917 RepID=A0AAI9UBD9_9PEZI|nr:hypothetical protein CCUS01_01927 [Colletotrichum cuscutae]